MASFKYDSLKDKYKNFTVPVAVVSVNGKNMVANKSNLVLNNIEVELTSGFEASIASFCIYNSFDRFSSTFRFEEIKKYVMIGSAVEISLGYTSQAMCVFVGMITRVNFVYEDPIIPYVKVTAMDVKGIMMASNYSLQLKALNYSDAVKEILEKTAYSKLSQREIIKKIAVTDTPDKKPGVGGNQKNNPYTIEMVGESDYEFVVKAAKKYNYEFFIYCGTVLFRKAKDDKDILIELSPEMGLRDFDIEYDITGIVEKIEARGSDPAKGKLFKADLKFKNKLSLGNKAKPLIAGSKKIYIDPTINSKEEASYRAQSLMEEMSYRFASLDGYTVGLPEIAPGRFVEIKGIGSPAENIFYLTSVRHVVDQDSGYRTYIKGKSSVIGGGGGAAGALGGGGGISLSF